MEWIKRQQILEAYKEKHGLRPAPGTNGGLIMADRKKLWRADLMWDSLVNFEGSPAEPGGPPRIIEGLGKKYRRTIWKQWMPTDEIIEYRKTNGTEDTRAAARSKFIGAMLARGSSFAVDWSIIAMETSKSKSKYGARVIKMGDPFQSKYESVDRYAEGASFIAVSTDPIINR